MTAADRAVWPSPRVGAGFAQEAEPGASQPARIWSIKLTLPLPLWQRNQGERAHSRAETAVAHAQLTAQDRALEVELRRLLHRVEAAARRIRAYGKLALPRLSESLAMSERAFESGEVDLLSVLSARGQLLFTREQALQVHVDYYEALAELETIAGIEIWSPASRKEVGP